MKDMKELQLITQNINVLFVDDDTSFLNETSEIFESIFNTVIKATNGKDALNKFNNNIDLIITDITMPIMDGIELIQEIKKINYKQPIIVLSAYNDADNLFSVLYNGACGFIMKPINAEQMFHTLYSISKQINFQQIYEQHLLQQTKLADMGSMIDIIAHQWLNPLSIMKMRTSLLETHEDDAMLNKEYVKDYTTEQIKSIEHLEETLIEFRDFLQPKESTDTILLQKIIYSVLVLLKDYIKRHNINLKLDCDDTILVTLHKNEFKHVLITIISNAIEALNTSQQSEKKINIKTVQENDQVVITIEDNAGGIAPEAIELIFNKNFTTKSDGTGIGLHLAKKILARIDGKIEADNVNDGASFKITIPNKLRT